MSKRDNGKPNSVGEFFNSHPDLNVGYSDFGELISTR